MEYENNFYRTAGNHLTVEFLFVRISEEVGWRAYILSVIDYSQYAPNRNTGGHQTHRLVEGDSEMKRKIKTFMRVNPPFASCPRRVDPENGVLNYICWTGRVQSLESIKLLASTWSEITAYYIRFGGTFEVIQPVLKRLGIIEL